MHTYDYALLALAALILAAAFFTSNGGSTAADRHWAPADIHFSGIHRSAAMLPEEDFPSH